MSYMIVSRDFWPKAAAIGDGLLELANKLAKLDATTVVAMSSINVAHTFKKNHLLQNANLFFMIAKSLTDSKSTFFSRIFESFIFVSWLILSLARKRPDVVYVATNPPILIPAVVAFYSMIFKKKFLYHIQDVHPEGFRLIVKMPDLVYATLLKLDTWSLNKAGLVVTITEQMRKTLIDRGCKTEIKLLENPSDIIDPQPKTTPKTIIFAGTAGRQQIMDIVIPAVERYIQAGGSLSFKFVGGGVYSEALKSLASNFDQVEYLGITSAREALEITSRCEWALLPIRPEVLKYAFPSKFPSYLAAHCNVVCVTDPQSSLGQLVADLKVGITVEPDIESFAQSLFLIEDESIRYNDEIDFSALFLTPNTFAEKLQRHIERL